ncbi:transcriptional regulator [Streptomyces sp. A1277]|uniref:helix-turn-helix domain-containing protein n=1 Tax=Streptomyces sp. A1277 TaxID=2563103 RepID=UPI0010A22134|nr:helix-turn-helix domain-containing protein [Streptomyces sp. A1277]THA29147.1 transcriptional regulator [Streptomyces sp. A1277]
MQHAAPACQLEHARTTDSRQKSAPKVGTQCQWISTTTGRIATDPHSWMTAVHWVNELATKGLYIPARTHGPKWGPTTVALAQELSALKECRPGVAYLTRKLRVSERTVQYHVGLLRDAGLLVYRSKGTRVRGGRNEASAYERTIPASFDEAHGIRTVGEGVQRRPVGAADTARKALGKLARKAARKVRRPRRRTPVSGRGRCTPMEGGSTRTSSAACSIPPSETKLASGSHTHTTPKTTTHKPRTLNKVGRRYQLARQLIENVPWLHNANVDRIAWIARHCADASWTWQEVQAAAEEHSPIDPADTRRPSGLLAYRLKGAHLLYADPAARRLMVTAWEDSRKQERFRHDGYDQAPVPQESSPAALVAREAIGAMFQPAIADDEEGDVYVEGAVDITALTRDEVLAHRELAAADPGYVTGFLAVLGDHDTRRLLTNRLVDSALALLRLNIPTTANAF